MDNPWLLGIFGIVAIYFGAQTLRLLPALFRLIVMLRSGAVWWPGPIAVYPSSDSNTKLTRPRIQQIHKEHLFSTFIGNTLGAAATTAFFSMAFLNGYLQLAAPKESRTWLVLFLTFIAFVGGMFTLRRVLHNMAQIKTLLYRFSDGIQHPLSKVVGSRPKNDEAFHLYLKSRMHNLANEEQLAANLQDQVLKIEPSFHDRIRDTLSGMVQGSSITDVGPIYYWIGIHSENLKDYQQAAVGYEKATEAFNQIGHKIHQGRAHSNLGSVHAKLGNSHRAMEEFEKAVTLNPKDGIAHFNIGMIYFMSNNRGDAEYELALNAFACAILADPDIYGPKVGAQIHRFSYTVREDLRDISRRVLSQ